MADEVEYAHITTCLDRARLALEQTGQIHCSMVVDKLQQAIDDVAEDFELNPNRPVEIVRWLVAIMQDDQVVSGIKSDDELKEWQKDRYVWFREASR